MKVTFTRIGKGKDVNRKRMLRYCNAYYASALSGFIHVSDARLTCV